jgi:hypothetical protein
MFHENFINLREKINKKNFFFFFFFVFVKISALKKARSNAFRTQLQESLELERTFSPLTGRKKALKPNQSRPFDQHRTRSNTFPISNRKHFSLCKLKRKLPLGAFLFHCLWFFNSCAPTIVAHQSCTRPRYRNVTRQAIRVLCVCVRVLVVWRSELNSSSLKIPPTPAILS